MWYLKYIPPKVLSLQARTPTGLLGRYVMPRIFRANAKLNTFIIECLDIQLSDRLLEVGFGPGELIREMASVASNGVVEGVEISRAMVKKTQQRNSDLIDAGRVKLYEADCLTLPFEDSMFDKICTSNTVYFWKDPTPYLDEMRRVLKPGGKIVLGFRDEKQMSHVNLSDNIYNLYSKGDLVDLLSKAGFGGARIMEKDDHPIASYCAVAVKP